MKKLKSLQNRRKSKFSEVIFNSKDLLIWLNFSKKPAARLTSYRIWTRLVIVVAVLIIAYFTASKDKERKFATRRESIIFRSQNLDCDIAYLNEITEFASCVPNKCGRFVTDSLVTEQEANLLLDLAKKGLSFGGGIGGASILDLHSGALSKGEDFVNIYKLPEAKGFLNEDALHAYKVCYLMRFYCA